MTHAEMMMHVQPDLTAPFAQLVLDADELLHAPLRHGSRHRALRLRCECWRCLSRRRPGLIARIARQELRR